MTEPTNSGRDLLLAAVEAAARGAADALDDEIPDAVHERDLLAITLAVERQRINCDAGWFFEGEEGGPPTVWTVLPTGQAAWRLEPEMVKLLARSPIERQAPTGGPDGHDVDLRRKRVQYHAIGLDERLEEAGQ